MKVAITGAVLGGGSGGMAGHAAADTGGDWDLASRCGYSVAAPACGGALPGAVPDHVRPPVPEPVVGAAIDAAAYEAATPPPDVEPVAQVPPPVAPVEVVDVAVVSSEVDGAQADSSPEAPPPVPDAAPVDPESPDPESEPVAQLVHASALSYDGLKEATLMALIHRYSGTPYIWGGDSSAGTDCSGLASWLANTATGRPIFGDRFDTSTEESELLERGFRYGTAPGALVIGWNDHHTAITLADGTPVASGEGSGIHIGGGGAYQPQFNHHMYLPITPGPVDGQPAAFEPPADGINS